MRTSLHRRSFATVLVGLIVVAWVALWQVESSAYGHYLHPYAVPGAHAHHAAAAGPLTAGSLFVAGWVLMTVAMMLPTTLPLVDMFRRLTRGRADQTALVSLLVGAYVLAWTVFGLMAYVAALSVGMAVQRAPWLGDHAWLASAGLFLVAGTFQFSALKYRCLEKCRSPLLFITERWRGSRERRQAFRLGLDHGLFCIGCCWALMLLMLGIGTAGLFWMLAIGALMAVEKNVRGGQTIGRPLGVVLIALGLVTVAYRVAL